MNSASRTGRYVVAEAEEPASCNGLLEIRILGGFRVNQPTGKQLVSTWSRRSAKTLVKVLATRPEHAIHREQIVDALWPEVELDSAFNSFGKALHAARHALEPELQARANSQYLLYQESMVSLDMSQVVVDADRFQALAHEALRCGDIGSYERALEAYGGELLPEDRYAEWCADRRSFLAELRLRVLLELAETLEAQGFYNRSVERLQEVIRQDPTRESVHRHLMRLYTQMEAQDQAVRQFRLCESALRRELGLDPQRETVLLYKEIVANREPREAQPPQRDRPTASSPASTAAASPPGTPLVGRDLLLQELFEEIVGTPQSSDPLVVLTGERGVGKTRLLEELSDRSSRAGVRVLRGGSGAHAARFACGPFAVALEGLAASSSPTERAELALRYPLLADLVPSCRVENDRGAPGRHVSEDHFELVAAIVRLLSDLSQSQPVLIVLGDLDATDALSLDLVRYLAEIRMHRRWMMVAAIRDEELTSRTEATRMLDVMKRQHLCRTVALDCLTRQECDELVCAALGDVQVRSGLLEEIFTLSLGNPQFVSEILAQIRHSPVVQLASGELSALAPFVSSRLRELGFARLSSIEQSTRRVLEMIALAGRRASLNQLRTWASALEPPLAAGELFDALDRALELRLVEEANGSYLIRSATINAVLHAGLPIHRREQLQGGLSTVRPVRSLRR